MDQKSEHFIHKQMLTAKESKLKEKLIYACSATPTSLKKAHTSTVRSGAAGARCLLELRYRNMKKSLLMLVIEGSEYQRMI